MGHCVFNVVVLCRLLFSTNVCFEKLNLSEVGCSVVITTVLALQKTTDVTLNN